ncbi:MAG: TIGR00730 family Rossman fold protein [Acidimicrobiia bacterium]
MNICVFCSAVLIDEKYTKPSLELVDSFTKLGHNLVWGGSDTGLMSQIANVAQSNSVKTFGVSVDFLKEVAKKDATEMTVAKDLSERKQIMVDKSDAFLVLPGGIGTLDEVTEIIEMKKHNYHSDPIVFLNVLNFYEGFKIQFDRMEKEGFLPEITTPYVEFAENPENALRFLGV